MKFTNRDFLVQAAERVAASYLFSFAGLLLADSFQATSVGAYKAAAIAAVPAALTVLKAVVSRGFGDENSGSLFK